MHSAYIQPALTHTHAYRESQPCMCASVTRVSYLDNWIMDELLAAGVYVVQVYNLIISPPLASYLRTTRFRPTVVVYVARRTPICIMRARSLAYAPTMQRYVMRERERERERERRVASRRFASMWAKQPGISHR